ncbi:MAG: DUF3325 family protein [Pseudomonadota bacterium]
MIGFSAALVGMACLAVTQSKHARAVLRGPLSPARRSTLLALGWLLLLSSAWLGVSKYGAGIGLTTFCAWICLAAWVVTVSLNWFRDRR